MYVCLHVKGLPNPTGNLSKTIPKGQKPPGQGSFLKAQFVRLRMGNACDGNFFFVSMSVGSSGALRKGMEGPGQYVPPPPIPSMCFPHLPKPICRKPFQNHSQRPKLPFATIYAADGDKETTN